MGQRVARGSQILTLVREIRGSLTHTVFGIYYYTLIRCGWRPAQTHAGVSKKTVLGAYGGKGGFEMLIPQTEKLSVRHSGISELSPPTKKASKKTVATTNDGERRRAATTDEDEWQLQAMNK